MAPGLCSEAFLLSLYERKSETKALRKEKQFTCKEVARSQISEGLAYQKKKKKKIKKHNRYVNKAEKPTELLRLPSL